MLQLTGEADFWHPTGFAIDAGPLVLGAALVAFLTTLASAVPAWTAAKMAAARPEGARPERSRSAALTHVLSRAWPSPAAATRVRTALQPGRGPTAIPVRPAIFGTTLSVAALTASLVFAASLGHLLNTPRLTGFTWDAFVAIEGGQSRAAAALRAIPSSPDTPVAGSPTCASAGSSSWRWLPAVRDPPGW